MDISIVIPLLNEEESLQELHDWIVSVMQSNRYVYELVFIDDGSSDSSWEIIQKLSTSNPSVKGIRFQKNFGKSQALDAGFSIVKGDVVITMDADLQDNPEEIPELFDLIKNQNFDLPLNVDENLYVLIHKLFFLIYWCILLLSTSNLYLYMK